MRIGKRYDLSSVGGIGEDFLIAGQRGIENDFTGGIARCADRLAAEDRTVRQRQHRRKICHGAFARVLQINKAGGVLVGTPSRLAWTNPLGLEVNLTGRHPVCPCDSKTFLCSRMDAPPTV